MKLTTIIGTAIAVIALAACGSSSITPATSPTPTPTAAPVPTPSPTPTPPPKQVVTRAGTQSLRQLSLVGENGTVDATVTVPDGIDGNAYYVGSDHLYFVSGTVVKALARDGSITVAGQIPQLATTVTAADRQAYTAFAVSPDESTLVFGIPLAVAGDNGATADHSQLWTEPVGGTAASATLVYNDANDTTNGGQVLLPFAWNSAGISVSQQPKGLGGAAPFGSFAEFGAVTFDSTTRTLGKSLKCTASNPSGSVCVIQTSPASLSPSKLQVVQSSGTTTLTMQPANPAEYGAVTVSADGRYLAYGSYIGNFAGGYYETHVVDLSTDTTVATLRNYAPAFWLSDGRLVVGEGQYQPGAWLLSPTFTSPVKISSNTPVGALGVLPLA
jgi:hypothetical protein